MYSCTAYNFYTYKVIGTLFVHRELQLHMKNSKNSRHCVRVYRTVWLYSKHPCLRSACNYNNNCRFMTTAVCELVNSLREIIQTETVQIGVCKQY